MLFTFVISEILTFINGFIKFYLFRDNFVKPFIVQLLEFVKIYI